MEKKEIQLEMPHDVSAGTYSNLSIISHSRSEFILDFASMLPGAKQPVVRSRIIMNPENAKRLLIAIQDNINKYEAKNGPISSGKPEATFDMSNYSGNGPIS